MNDRVQSALKVLGIGVPPAATLEREGAFFALLEDTLIYQDAGGTRRVTLRDLTRIHSDEEGLLRVETPAGTALIASLLGYDPARVQAFFAQVRDATARAKHLPTSPLPGMSGQKTFGSAPAPAAAARGQAPALPPREEAGPQVRPDAGRAQAPENRPAQSDPSPPRERPAPPASPRSTQWKPPGQNDLGGETVRVIGPSARVQTPAPAPTTPTKAPPTPAPIVVTPTLADPAPVTVTPEVAPAAPAPAGPRVRPGRARGGLADLDARAEGVLGWVGRLRLLAAVLGLAALGLAAFQFAEGPRLTGLWTLIVGGVGALALLAFAEVADLVVSLARTVAGEGRDGATDAGGGTVVDRPQ
ncbi:hypothetical protein DAETH_12020 [Deinococcus aetherius]|uniref:Uncharacterized protein n=1 Tax=Deinococcus aetherius TaxID=200252 RepID=A0ABM8AC70_9DEIO|nr:hypothetical protein [Deinococcus aetherius]BDP41233.1 hypothetical protein DAETH_12020 [Deinococcus aetherius]